MFSPSRCLDHNRPHHDMLLASMLGSPQGDSGVLSSALQRQIAHATCAYGFHCQFKDSSCPPNSVIAAIVSTPSACRCQTFQDAETQVDSHVNMDQSNLDSCSFQHAGQNADEDSFSWNGKRKRRKKRALNDYMNICTYMQICININIHTYIYIYIYI